MVLLSSSWFFCQTENKSIGEILTGTQRNLNKNKEERYSRVPRLSDTRYSKGNGDKQAAKRD